MENRFNLVDEPWIPVADVGRVSLRQIFSNPEYRSLGGNPVQKIALMKLLLAIAQAAETPVDEDAWRVLGAKGLAERCLSYLDQWHDRFYLYGTRPFLQMPTIEGLIVKRTTKRLQSANTKGKLADASISGFPKPLGAGFYPDLPSDNNTVLSHTLASKEQSDSDRALFLVTIMNFAFGGKRVESDLTSLGGMEIGIRYTAAAGPSLGGWVGQLHCFLITEAILVDIWINTLTNQNIDQLNRWPEGLGCPPWENMPKTEVDQIASKHKESYQATLVALSRFVLLKSEGIFYTDGLKYPSIKDGWHETSLFLNNTGKKVQVKYVDPDKRPWRELQSMLSFIGDSGSSGFECFALRNGVDRLRDPDRRFAVWCAGLSVSSNSGDQSVKQDDDFVESTTWLHGAMLGEGWFSLLKAEMTELDGLANGLYGRVMAYYKVQKVRDTDCKKTSAQTTHLFWQLCERNFQKLVDSCGPDEIDQMQRRQLRRVFAAYVHQAYDRFCPKETARQLDAWAKCRPNNSKYLTRN